MYAVITGASSGIGKEMANLLAARGMNLILVARRMDRLEALQVKLQSAHSIQVVCLQYNLSVLDNCYSLFEACSNYPIKIVINNAGFGLAGRFDKLSLEDELSMIQTNVMAVHILTKLFARNLKKGLILNVASIAGFVPSPIMSTYGATKAYVVSLSQAVNYEMKRAGKNVHVSVLCPGPVDTEFNQVAGADFSLRAITAKQCAKEAIDGLFKRKDIIIPSLTTKLMRQLLRITPNKLLLPVEYKIQTKKLNQDKL